MTDARRILFEKESIVKTETAVENNAEKERNKKQILEEIRRFSSEQESNVEHFDFHLNKVEEPRIAPQMIEHENELELPVEESTELIDIQQAFQADLEIASIAYPEVQSQKKKSLLFRVKIITIAFIMSVSLMSGAAIHNSMEIGNLSQAVQQAKQTDFQIKLEKLILKIIGADGSQEKVESVVDSHPEELKDITFLEAPTNWWNKLCSSIAHFFGGGFEP